MATITKIKWSNADFKWEAAPPSQTYKPGFTPSTFPYTWDNVSLIEEIIEVVDAGGTVDGVIKDLDKKKKKKLIRLIMKMNGIKKYDEEKEVKNIHAKVKDVELIIKEARSSIKVII